MIAATYKEPATTNMLSDVQAAKQQLPPELVADAELALMVQRTFGLNPGIALDAAVLLVIEHRRRQEAASNG